MANEHQRAVQPISGLWGLGQAALQNVSAWAWRALLSPAMLLGLLGVMLATGLAGGLLPRAAQVPWRGAGIERSIGWAPHPWALLADTAGLSLAWGERLWSAYLALGMVVCVLRCLTLYLPWWAGPAQRMLKLHEWNLPGEPERVWARFGQVLSDQRFRIARRTDSLGVQHALCRRKGIATWGPGIGCAGVLLLVLATRIAAWSGWRGAPLDLSLGEARPLGAQTGAAIRLDGLQLFPGPDGALARFVSELSLIEAAAARQYTVELGRGVMHDGLSLYLLGFGPAARVSAPVSSGWTLEVQPLRAGSPRNPSVRLRFPKAQHEQLLTIPEANLNLRLVHYVSLPSQGIPGRAMHVQVYENASGQLLAERFLDKSDTLIVRGQVMEIAFEYFVTVRGGREPHLPLAALGALGALVGLVMSCLWSPQDLVITVMGHGDQSLCRIAAASQSAGADWISRLQSCLDEEAHG